MALEGAEVRRYRKIKGYSQEKLAIVANVSPRSILRAEQSLSISPLTAISIANALKIPVEVLLPQPEIASSRSPLTFEITCESDELDANAIAQELIDAISRAIHSTHPMKVLKVIKKSIIITASASLADIVCVTSGYGAAAARKVLAKYKISTDSMTIKIGKTDRESRDYITIAQRVMSKQKSHPPAIAASNAKPKKSKPTKKKPSA